MYTKWHYWIECFIYEALKRLLFCRGTIPGNQLGLLLVWFFDSYCVQFNLESCWSVPPVKLQGWFLPVSVFSPQWALTSGLGSPSDIAAHILGGDLTGVATAVLQHQGWVWARCGFQSDTVVSFSVLMTHFPSQVRTQSCCGSCWQSPSISLIFWLVVSSPKLLIIHTSISSAIRFLPTDRRLQREHTGCKHVI